ncbi:MAG: transaldolase family protein [Anaerolineaceae bacterium]|nr:transaldolase family protein [Anaerolineaceae bacterium]
MNKESYFIRVSNQSPTMFWINNPTRLQADMALENGALGCTNNPSFSQKMIDHPDEKEYALKLLDEAIRETSNPNETAEVFQRKLVKPIADKFMPLFNKSAGQHGYVSIQGDPINEDDPQIVIRDAIANRKLSPNICCKIPTTVSGLKAIETMIEENIPINATEIFGISQFVAICEMYQQVSAKTGNKPMFYMSHIAGIYDDYLRNYVKENDVQISPDVLHQAGLAVARKVYLLMLERNYPCVFIGGGARGLHHFTEMVGGKVCLTINWEGTADQLIEQDPPVVYRLFNPVPLKVIDELLEKLPDFKRGYLPDGLEPEEFEHFGPVQLFRSSFVKSWRHTLDVIGERRANLATA